MNSIQTQFMSTISPAHHGDQGFLHQDIHHHLGYPDGTLLKNGPISQNNHQPLTGQTTLNDFLLQKKPGIW